MIRLSLLSLLALLAAPTLAKNHSPQDANELEAAVLLSNPGDRIVLLDQIYFLTRPINLTMRSHLIFEGQGSTVFDGKRSSRLFELDRTHGMEFWNVIFQNGYASMGGGVLVQESSSVLFQKCQFASNTADGAGGGLMMIKSRDVELVVTSFNGNQAQRGGGLGLTDSSLVNVWECTFSVNAASVGGALFAEGGDACSVDHSAFRSNTAEIKGPAIAIKGMAVFQLGLKNTFEGNTVDSSPQALPVVATSSSVVYSYDKGKILSQLECANAESSATVGERLKRNDNLQRNDDLQRNEDLNQDDEYVVTLSNLSLEGAPDVRMENLYYMVKGAHAETVKISARAVEAGSSLIVPTWKLPVFTLEVVEMLMNGRTRRLGKVEIDFDAQPSDDDGFGPIGEFPLEGRRAGGAVVVLSWDIEKLEPLPPSAVELSAETHVLTTHLSAGFASGLVVGLAVAALLALLGLGPGASVGMSALPRTPPMT
ncbi:pectin lyase fold/virulence factor [Pavlovales sp. CCMP2436]|nr:pectin lyase fold/virulence factor [Pavlovales sp. CCMP2436]